MQNVPSSHSITLISGCAPPRRLPSNASAVARGVSAPIRKLSGSRAQRLTCKAESGGMIVREALSSEGRTKLDSTSDSSFYEFPRFVTHVDDGFLSQLTQVYRERIPAEADVLDLCSSWISHLPDEVEYGNVVGHGLNAQELNRNRRLGSYFVRNLNESPKLEGIPDESFDAVICCVSVQYLQFPEKVFAEVYRVLRPGGVAIFSFSNRMFFQKAVAAWRDAPSGYARSQLVKSYFMAVAGFTAPEALTQPAASPPRDTSLFGILKDLFARSSSDPFYAVVSYRNFKPIRE